MSEHLVDMRLVRHDKIRMLVDGWRQKWALRSIYMLIGRSCRRMRGTLFLEDVFRPGRGTELVRHQPTVTEVVLSRAAIHIHPIIEAIG